MTSIGKTWLQISRMLVRLQMSQKVMNSFASRLIFLHIIKASLLGYNGSVWSEGHAWSEGNDWAMLNTEQRKAAILLEKFRNPLEDCVSTYT